MREEHLLGRFCFELIRPLIFTASGSPSRESAFNSYLGNVGVHRLLLLVFVHAFTLMFVKISSNGRRLWEPFFIHYQKKRRLCQCEEYWVI